MSDCTCHAPEDAEPEDHDADCPEYSGEHGVEIWDDDFYYGE